MPIIDVNKPDSTIVSTLWAYRWRAFRDNINWLIYGKKRHRIPFDIEKTFAQHPSTTRITISHDLGGADLYVRPDLASVSWLMRDK